MKSPFPRVLGKTLDFGAFLWLAVSILLWIWRGDIRWGASGVVSLFVLLIFSGTIWSSDDEQRFKESNV